MACINTQILCGKTFHKTSLICPVSLLERSSLPNFVVRNKGRVSVTVDDLFLKVAHPTQGKREARIPEIYGDRDLPFRLEPVDRIRFTVALPLMFARLEHTGFEGLVKATATVVDGLGNRYETNAVDVDLSKQPPPEPV